jgi:hypothetical protein
MKIKIKLIIYGVLGTGFIIGNSGDFLGHNGILITGCLSGVVCSILIRWLNERTT